MRPRLARSLCSAAATAVLLLPASAAAAPGLASEDHVFPTPAADATSPAAAMAPNGFAAVAGGEQGAAGAGVVDVAVRPPGQDWSPVAVLDTKANPGDPPTGRMLSGLRVAINARGDAAVAWDERKSPSTF